MERADLRKFNSGVVVSLVLFLVYVVTLAPGVTYWDAGEFLAAMHSLGIPHPPGTPLFILVGNVWGRALGPLLGFAQSVNLLSAASTAVACGIFASRMAGWTGDRAAATAGGVLAGLMSSVWLNANETEVYAPALLMSALFILAADLAVARKESKWLIMLAYLFGLGWALQLSALVAAPAALLLALYARRTLKIATLPAIVIVTVLGASVALFMIVRAQHDPAVNQGNPETWQALSDVITRKQYQPVSFFPRQAPWYIQVGNFIEYTDWQVALGLNPSPPPSFARTTFTALYAVFGAVGFTWHRRTHAMSWRVMTLLFICASLGVIAYLNMKASPSYGDGFLPTGAKHEARERDYFFALAFLCWGIWAGAGAVKSFQRFGARWALAGFAIAILPAFLNFPATNRRSGFDEVAPRDSATRILAPVPRNAVVFAYGDNDTYPVWYMQEVEGYRTDVTTVTLPLLGAGWYRDELRRRHNLIAPDLVPAWSGWTRILQSICSRANELGRPIVAKPVRDRPQLPDECSRVRQSR